MFLWQAKTFLAECRRHQPDLEKFILEFPKEACAPYLAERFPELPKISVDYAIMEHASSVVALIARFDWDDVGSWTALPSHLGQDAEGKHPPGTGCVALMPPEISSWPANGRWPFAGSTTSWWWKQMTPSSSATARPLKTSSICPCHPSSGNG